MYKDDYASRVVKFGENHEESIGSLTLLGAKLLETGGYKEAEDAFTRVAGYWHREAGPTDVRYLNALSCRGEVLERLGRLKEAETDLQEAVVGLEEAFGSDDSRTLRAVNRLAQTLYGQLRFEEAERFYRAALAGTHLCTCAVCATRPVTNHVHSRCRPRAHAGRGPPRLAGVVQRAGQPAVAHGAVPGGGGGAPAPAGGTHQQAGARGARHTHVAAQPVPRHDGAGQVGAGGAAG